LLALKRQQVLQEMEEEPEVEYVERLTIMEKDLLKIN
jgi:hypothetical protein